MISISILAKDLKDKFYTDAKIKFIDDFASVSIDVHRVVLAMSSEFFDKLFHFNKFDSYDIFVPNITCAIDIVNEFYGSNKNDIIDWTNTLDYVKCRNFFGLTIDMELLRNLVVPSDGFELYLNTIEQLLFTFDVVVKDQALVRAIKHNLPSNYDINQLSPILAKEINHQPYTVESITYAGLNIFDLSTNHHELTRLEKLVGRSQDRQLKCYFVTDYKLVVSNKLGDINYIKTDLPYHKMAISPNNKHIVISEVATYTEDCEYLRCYDISTSKLIWTYHDYICDVAYTPNGKYIVLTSVGGYDVVILDPADKKIIRKINTMNYQSKSINISPNSKFVLTRANKQVMVWNIKTSELLQNFQLESDEVAKCFSTNSKSILIGSPKEKTIKFKDIISGEIIHCINNFDSVITNISHDVDQQELLIATTNAAYVFYNDTKKLVCEYRGIGIIDFYKSI